MLSNGVNYARKGYWWEIYPAGHRHRPGGRGLQLRGRRPAGLARRAAPAPLSRAREPDLPAPDGGAGGAGGQGDRGLQREVAGRLVGGAEVRERRFLLGAQRLGPGASGSEPAARGWGDRPRAARRDLRRCAARPAAGDVGHRYGVQQALGVGVGRVLVDLRGRSDLHQLAQVHDPDGVGHVPDNRQVVGDHEEGQARALLQVLHQVEDLGLDRHVEGRDRLVGHDQLGLEGQGPGQPDALALAARELVGVAVHRLGAQADLLSRLTTRARCSPACRPSAP